MRQRFDLKKSVYFVGRRKAALKRRRKNVSSGVWREERKKISSKAIFIPTFFYLSFNYILRQQKNKKNGMRRYAMK